MNKRLVISVVGLSLALLLILPFVTACSQPAAVPPASSGAAPAPAAKAEPIALKTIGIMEASRIRDHGGDWIKDRIYSMSGGRLAVNYVGGPETIDIKEQFAALQNGIVDMTYTWASYHESIVPEMNLLNFVELNTDGLPNPEAFTWLNERYVNAGVRLLGQLKFYGPFYVGTAKKVNSFAELKKLKFNGSAAAFVDFFKSFDIATVNIGASDIYTAVQQGLIDGANFQSDTWRLGLPEVIHYIIVPPFKSESNTSCLINLKTWNKLGPDLQKVLNDVMATVAHDGILRDLGMAQMDLQIWQNAGTQLIRPFTTDEEKAWTSRYADQNWARAKTKVSADSYAKMQQLALLPAKMAKFIRP